MQALLRDRYNSKSNTSTSGQDGVTPSGPPPRASGPFADEDRPADSLTAESSARNPAPATPASQVGSRSSSSQSSKDQGSGRPSSQADLSGLQQQVMFAAGLAAASGVLPDSDSDLEVGLQPNPTAAAQLDTKDRQESMPLPSRSPLISEAAQHSDDADSDTASMPEQGKQESGSSGQSASGEGLGSQEATTFGQASTGPEQHQTPLGQIEARGWTDSVDHAPAQSDSQWYQRQASDSNAGSLANIDAQPETTAGTAQQEQDRAGQVQLGAAWQEGGFRSSRQLDQGLSRQQAWGASAWQRDQQASHVPDAASQAPSLKASFAAEVALPPLEVDQMSFDERLQAGRDCFRYDPSNPVYDVVPSHRD